MDATRERELERHRAATIRAVAAAPLAEFRAHRLTVDDVPVPIATPYLAVDLTGASMARSRGVADALALLLRHTDLELHRELSPTAPLERIVFDILEQLRCESLTPPELPGVRHNVRDAFDGWCREARAARIGENGVGLLVYTITHMARGRLISRELDPEVDDLIEVTRGNLARLVGHALAQLAPTREAQAAYAVPAREIARLVAEMAGDALSEASTVALADRLRLIVPPEWDADATVPTTERDAMAARRRGAGGGAEVVDLNGVAGYLVYSRAHDRLLDGADLYPSAVLDRLRRGLDASVTAQAVSIPRLALRMRTLFARPASDDWEFAQESGVLDGRRLTQAITNPANHDVFRRDRIEPTCDTVVAFLIDNSGSMKAQRLDAVAVLVDTYARALDLAGVATEVLGFTTGSWTGGRAAAEWRAAGEPADPGRLADVDHIVYKPADQRWRRARRSIAAMCQPAHFREGIDGEALVWALDRLQARPERRRVLVVISDGSPMETATTNHNRAGFLPDHLTAVAGHIERHTDVELGAIGLDLDLGAFYRNTVTLDLAGTLTLAHYRALERLFPPRP